VYLAAPVVTLPFLWSSTSEIGPTMQLLKFSFKNCLQGDITLGADRSLNGRTS